MNPLIQIKTTPPLLITVALLCFRLLPGAQAVVPPPDGGYAGGNTAEGKNALLTLATGVHNTAIGYLSLKSNNGSYNTALGSGTLLANTADGNTVAGTFALLSNTTGNSNTASGAVALLSNTTGSGNTANGFSALQNNTIGGNNTATGVNALSNNTMGDQNTATGYAALASNTTGDDNTANGVSALTRNTVGGLNTAVGFFALELNTNGNSNTAVGYTALESTSGSENTAVGNYALSLNTTGNSNTAVGVFAGVGLSTGDNNIDIGYSVSGVADESNTIRIGNEDITDTYISGISGTTVASGAAVLVDSSGHLGTVTSSKRFKEEIRPMNTTSEAIFSLKPVTFRYKKGIDRQGIPQFGLVAEDVEAVNPELVVRDKEGKPYSVRYEAVNAMLLNEFLKEHRKVEQQDATISGLESAVKKQEAANAQQQKQIESLTAGLQKVSAQLELSKPAPQTALNND
jgi:uncharacterized coiled-coil protein SlyX